MKVIIMAVGDRNNPSSYAVVSSHEILEMGFNTKSQAKEWIAEKGYENAPHIFSEDELARVKAIAFAWQHYCEKTISDYLGRAAYLITDEHRFGDIELFYFWYEENFLDGSGQPFKRSELISYLNLLSSMSLEALGGMELQAMSSMSSEMYTLAEVTILGKTCRDAVEAVLNGRVDEFRIDLARALRNVHESDRWLSMGKVLTAARQWTDGGIINLNAPSVR